MREELRARLFLVIMAAYLTIATAYAIKTPTWETPDEPAHFNYVRYLAERREFPILQIGDYDQAYLDKLKAARFPQSMPVDSVRYESWQPPLYYLLSVPLYWASSAVSVPQQVIVLRLLSVALGAVLLLVSYKVARRLFPKDDYLTLAVPAFIATLPQHVAMTAAVNNDTLAEVIISLILLTLVCYITDAANVHRSEHSQLPREGGRNRWVIERTHILLGVLLGVGVLTKTSLFVAAALIPLGLLLRQYVVNYRHAGERILRDLSSVLDLWVFPLLRQLIVVFAVALALSGWWFVRNAFVYGDLDFLGWKRHDVVAQGQPLTGVFDLGYAKFFATSTFKSFWAQFGWMGVVADERTYILVGVLTAVVVVGVGLFIFRVVRLPESLTPSQQLCLLLLGSAFVLVLGVLVAYNFRFIQAQGRYLFPALVPIAVFFSLGLREIVAERYVPLVFALVYVALLTLDYVSLTRFILPQLAG